MRTWRISKLDQECGSCASAIRDGDRYLEIHLSCGVKLRRCQPCGERQFGPADEDAVVDIGVDDSREGRAYQPPLVAELQQAPTNVVSVGELARRRASNHFRQRGRR